MSHSSFGDYKDNFVLENASSLFFRPENCFSSGEIFGQPFAMRIENGTATLILPGNDYESRLDVSLPENGGVENDYCPLVHAGWIFKKLVSDWDFKPQVLIPVPPFSNPNSATPAALLTF